MKTTVRLLAFAVFAAAAVAALAAPLTAHAQIWDGRYDVSCNVEAMPCSFCDLLKVGANIVDFISLLVVPIVTVMVVYGGFLVMTTGSSARVTKGWEAIRNAVFGFVITIGAWVIVNTVFGLLSGGGGGIMSIQCPGGDLINRKPYTPASGDCKSLELTVSNDAPLGPRLSAVAVGQFGLTDWCNAGKVDENLQRIQTDLTWLRGELARRVDNLGPFTIVVSSAFRPKSYQAHLREVYDKNDLLKKNQATLDRCDEARDVYAEMSRHGLGSEVANPGNSPHERGYGVDLIINGCGNGSNFTGACRQWYNTVSNVLQTTPGGHVPTLKWRELSGDEVHFELLENRRVQNEGC